MKAAEPAPPARPATASDAGDAGGAPLIVPPHRGAELNSIEVPAETSARMHGKLFYEIGGSDYVCSATVISSRHLNLVATAAHCLNSGGKWAEEVVFAPAYEDGETPLGRWVAKELAVTAKWQQGEDVRYDVGMVKVRRNPEGFLERYVGARGIGFNTSRDHRYKIYGYPGVEPFDGEELYRCAARFAGLDLTMPSPRPMRAACELTAGASGGGWVVKGRRLLSVVSYSYGCSESSPEEDDCDHPEHGNVFGPYFGDQVLHLYNRLGGPPKRFPRHR